MNFITPTDNSPLILEDSKIFATFFEAFGEKVTYDQIHGLTILIDAKSYNGITTKEARLYVHFSLSNSTNVLPSDTKYFLMGRGSTLAFFGKEKYNKILFVYGLLQRATFNSRLKRYMNAIEENGYFTYTTLKTSFLGESLEDSATIYNNGDTRLPNGEILNLFEANQNELLGIGSELKGLKTVISNPCELVVFKNKGLKLNLLGFDLFPSIKIDYRYNQDVFLEILYRIINNRKILD